jgi:hypothetical protein
MLYDRKWPVQQHRLGVRLFAPREEARVGFQPTPVLTKGERKRLLDKQLCRWTVGLRDSARLKH